MQKLDHLCSQITRDIPKIKSGSFRFWGVWFGRPHDNVHVLVECKAEEGGLKMRFDMGEMLFVWSPQGVTINAASFRISDALRIRWEWLPYGVKGGSSNVNFQEFTKNGNVISFVTNVPGGAIGPETSNTEAAVEMF
jgi:hypothetical protein